MHLQAMLLVHVDRSVENIGTLVNINVIVMIFNKTKNACPNSFNINKKNFFTHYNHFNFVIFKYRRQNNIEKKELTKFTRICFP